MKKILCPCDFSETALRGVEAAARVADRITASLTVCYVQPSVWPEAVFLEPVVEESRESVETKLSTICDHVRETFGTSCDFTTTRTTDTIDDTIAGYSDAFDLIVMGTNGADDFLEYFFGNNSFHVAAISGCPVLVIPDNINGSLPSRMIYLHQEAVNPELDILVPVWWSQLLGMEFGIWIGPSGNELLDREHAEKVHRFLEGENPEKLIAFIETHPAPVPGSHPSGDLFALAVNPSRRNPRNSGKRLLRHLLSTTSDPVLVFDVC